MLEADDSRPFVTHCRRTGKEMLEKAGSGELNAPSHRRRTRRGMENVENVV